MLLVFEKLSQSGNAGITNKTLDHRLSDVDKLGCNCVKRSTSIQECSDNILQFVVPEISSPLLPDLSFGFLQTILLKNLNSINALKFSFYNKAVFVNNSISGRKCRQAKMLAQISLQGLFFMDFYLIIFTTIGFISAGLLSYSAYRFGLLSINGAWAAVFIGGFTFGLGGLKAAALLVFFFLSTSLIPIMRDKYTGTDKKSKPMRNWKQVLVNGGPGLIILLLNYYIIAGDVLWPVYAGMIAAVTADTWATELGVLSKRAPRKITTWKAVERGTSGAVSFIGFCAAFSGMAQ